MTNTEKTPDPGDRLREALASLAPEPPQAPGRAAAARRLHRRRRARLASAGAVAALLVVVAVPLAWNGLGTDDSVNIAADDPGNSSSEAGAFAAAGTMSGLACAPPVADGPLPALTGADTLPEDAVAVLACNPGGSGNWQAPADALTQDVDALVELVNTAPLRVGESKAACKTDLGPTWEFVFGYADGSTRAIRVEQYGCGGIVVGDAIRDGDVDALVEGFIERLFAQREAGTPPSPAPALELDCGQDHAISLLPTTPPLDLVDAQLCWSESRTREDPGQAPIDASDLATLIKDFNSHAAPRTSEQMERAMEPCPLMPETKIVAVTAWGDRIVLSGWCGDFDLGGDGPLTWTPSPEAQKILDRLMS